MPSLARRIAGENETAVTVSGPGSVDLVERILVSGCLLGQPVRYDGTGRLSEDPIFTRWRADGRLVAVCPEIRGGLPVPRPAAELTGGLGADVLDGQAQVLTQDGTDVTAHFVSGARRALETAHAYGVRLAVLKEGSPSCGSRRVADGTFTGHKLVGDGVTAALLTRHGIAVFGEDDLAAAEAYLRQ